ncbi:MAG: DJ-1/PfpI/YhbO family deglycase/protease [Myxococcota bacterium]
MTSVRKNVAFLVEQHVDDSEFKVPLTALRQAGAEVTVLGSRMDEQYEGQHGRILVTPDGTTTEARASDYDAVIIPGGMAPDIMRTNMKTVRFVQEAMRLGKVVAAVCHGPQVLIEGDLLRGRRATGFRAVRKDMVNAGCQYVNEPCVVDGNLITSRHAGDLPIFSTAVLRKLDLGLPIRGVALPELNNLNAEWWKLGEEWGGSTRDEILSGVNAAIHGERWALSAFERYAEKADDPALRSLFGEICATKQMHVNLLQGRLTALGGREVGKGPGALQKVKTLFQSSDDISLLRRALGDLQAGVVDAANLNVKFTDPATAEVFRRIEIDLAKHERMVGDVYRSKVGAAQPRPAVPSDGASLGA